MTAPATQGAVLFGRYAQVQIDTVELDTNTTPNQRFVFETSKTRTKEPNKSHCSVYNLNDTDRAKMKKQNVFVSIDAGYTGLHGVIFSGWLRTVDQLRQHAEWVTTAKGGDGEVIIRQQRISQSWGPGTTTATILIAIAKATGLALGNVPAVAASGKFRRSKTVWQKYHAFGSAYDALDKLSWSLGYQLSVQNGSLMMMPVTGARTGLVIVLNESSGLRGSPEVGEKGIIKATSSLNCQYQPGSQVLLQSSRYNGNYTVQKVTHKGDTHGTGDDSWVSILEMTPVNTAKLVQSP